MTNKDYLRGKGWGVFAHYLETCQNNPARENSQGRHTDWDACVNEFDVELFARQMAAVRAPYVVFTIMQCKRFLCAPNATFDRISGYQPGEACSKRDLIEDLYAALSRHGIDLLLYFTGDGPMRDEQAGPAFGFTEADGKKGGRGITMPFVEQWASVLEEYTQRYGNKIKGWWVDGCYRSASWNIYHYTDELLQPYRDAIKKGNPDAMVAFNQIGNMPERVSCGGPLDDFTCGEMAELTDVPDSQFVGGAQWHILSYLGVPPETDRFAGWGKPGVRYSGDDLRDYVQRVSERGGAVSIDVCLYRDGSIDSAQLEALKAINGN